MYLIIGASGFIGKHLYDHCIERNVDVLGTYYKHCYNSDWIKFDMCTDNLESVCKKYANGKVPDFVIICGANASIDGCKGDEKASYRLNVTATKRVIAQADRLGAKCIFLSSEAVFDGTQGMYTEEDVPNPITLYGRQKLQIEQYIIKNIKKYLILRISRAVGSRFGEKDIFKEFYTKMTKQEEIICLKNQSFCLTEIRDITEGILKSIEQDLSGLYHLSSANYISRYELSKLYAEKIFGGYDKIMEKNYSEIHFLDNRQIFGGLIGNKLAGLLNYRYLDTTEILNKYLDSYNRRTEIM